MTGLMFREYRLANWIFTIIFHSLEYMLTKFVCSVELKAVTQKCKFNMTGWTNRKLQFYLRMWTCVYTIYFLPSHNFFKLNELFQKNVYKLFEAKQNTWTFDSSKMKNEKYELSVRDLISIGYDYILWITSHWKCTDFIHFQIRTLYTVTPKSK